MASSTRGRSTRGSSRRGGSTRGSSRLDRTSLWRRRPSALVTCTGLFIVISVTLGGGPDLSPGLFALFTLFGTMLLGVAVWRGGLARFNDLAMLDRVAIAAVILLPAVQLLPLPHDWWSALPGRELAAQVLAAAGQPSAWRPATLDVTATLGTLSIVIWMVGLLLAMLAMSQREVRQTLMLVVVLTALHVAIGTVQFLSHGDSFVFYRLAHRGALIGFFANKNHAALFIAIGMLVAYALVTPAQLRDRRVQSAAAGLALLMVVALIATLSRAGLMLGLLALGFMWLFQQLDRSRIRWRPLLGGAAALLVTAALINTSAAATRIFDRFGGITGDVRQGIWQRSAPLIDAYWPWGAGLGSFPDVFAVSERLDWLEITYLNHAHNDYMELLIEAGIPALVLMIVLGVALVSHAVGAWRERRLPGGRQALIGVMIVTLCLLHSVVDYPLRRLAITVLFALGWALALRPAHEDSIA